MNRTDALTTLKGVGPKKAQKLSALGLSTVEDLLYHVPTGYEDTQNFKTVSTAEVGEKATLSVIIDGITRDSYIKGKHVLSFEAHDSTGTCSITFFNAPFMKKSVHIKGRYDIYGKINRFKHQIQIASPKMERAGAGKVIGTLVPKYSLTHGLSNTELAKLIAPLLGTRLFDDPIPKGLRDKYGLKEKNEALAVLHHPDNPTELMAATQRMAYEELLLLQLKTGFNRDKVRVMKPMRVDERVDDFIASLSFELTEGQQEAVEEIKKDLASGKKMNRLLQGDVGSGKTIVAIITMVIAAINGYQSTIMAPTEILAKQHLESFRSVLEPFGMKVELLVGSTSAKNRRRILSDIEMGAVDVLIGTHALLEERVQFYNLGLTVTDEQHRFGVRQRQSLMTKTPSHTLVMSATPIPRTLALVLYADLDISLIKTMPKGRIPITTTAISAGMIPKALDFIEGELNQGRQAYIVCPLIEEGVLNLNDATTVYDTLKERFQHHRVALLHGKMNPQEKSEIMAQFAGGDVDVMVATTVIEVGVNVPNATVMMVYNAERFGLAQLHQLRGRVGRGAKKSYCILYNAGTSDISWERMKVITGSTDGFYVAEEDLKLRGAGELFGTRQSGVMSLRFADVLRDVKILKIAAEDAKAILKTDPDLEQADHQLLKTALMDVFKKDEGLN
ncbi:ATP-dependent DNA helicase RecG [Peptoniphilus equinus]|uniref:ATP-dependent DNA helicase RecG n=1 Tax=Peptoniphilus equinus TaxID=3016343 RepID=A0ABY7QS14_9FIRM|nr:ATP-dependent DNA helicase RecG [Peptoniphilus equinus]WBW49580.1 ATP-dependent DNA helicase RecG [Peptoniphilus equinus]